MSEISSRIATATRGEQRHRLAQTLVALRPSQTRAITQLGSLVEALLGTGLRTDQRTALLIVDVLPARDRNRRLSAVVRRAIAAGFSPTERDTAALKRAGIND